MERSPPLDIRVDVVRAPDLSDELRDDVHRLQVHCFSDVPVEELYEDFVAESFAKVLAFHRGALVGCVSVFEREIEYEGRRINLGGFGGTCTRADLRGRGVGTRVSAAAMELLHQERCDVAFLAVGESSGTAAFYARFGFVLLGRPFTFVGESGMTKAPARDNVGMIAPVVSRGLFELVLRGRAPLHLGPEKGYW